jgi:uncharacterized membrane protein YkvA (DUF1232 family)
MDDFPRQQLGEIIAQYGPTITEDRRRLENLLSDLCGEYRREINVLISALNERVPQELLSAPEQTLLPVLIAQLSRRLQDDLGLTDEAARWAVESWAMALGIDVPQLPTRSNQLQTGFIIPLPSNFAMQLRKITQPYIDQVRLAWLLMFDARVPIAKKLIPIVALVYLLSPISFFTALVPLVGPLADLTVFLSALVLFNMWAPAEVVKEHKARLHRSLSETRRERQKAPKPDRNGDDSSTEP